MLRQQGTQLKNRITQAPLRGWGDAYRGTWLRDVL